MLLDDLHPKYVPASTKLNRSLIEGAVDEKSLENHIRWIDEKVGTVAYVVTLLNCNNRLIDYHGKAGHMTLIVYGSY
jgi:hypothetical protein